MYIYVHERTYTYGRVHHKKTNFWVWNFAFQKKYVTVSVNVPRSGDILTQAGHIFFLRGENFNPNLCFFALKHKGGIGLYFSKKIKRLPRLSSDIKRAQIVTASDNFQKGYPSKASIRIPARSAGASHPT